MTEHLLKEFVRKVEVSTTHWDAMKAQLMEELKDKLSIDMTKHHYVIHSMDADYKRDYAILESGDLVEVMLVWARGTGYRLDESADQTLRKMAIDEATRG